MYEDWRKWVDDPACSRAAMTSYSTPFMEDCLLWLLAEARWLVHIGWDTFMDGAPPWEKQ